MNVVLHRCAADPADVGKAAAQEDGAWNIRHIDRVLHLGLEPGTEGLRLVGLHHGPAGNLVQCNVDPGLRLKLRSVGRHGQPDGEGRGCRKKGTTCPCTNQIPTKLLPAFRKGLGRDASVDALPQVSGRALRVRNSA